MFILIILQLNLINTLVTTSEFSGPAVVLKDTLSSVEYAGISLLPETSIYFEFYGHNPHGRLLYAENASMGTFISLKINRPGTLRFEMKLTELNRSYQFIILSAKLDQLHGKWHSANIRIYLEKMLAVLYVDGRDAYPARLEEMEADTAMNSFGDFLYVGRLPPYLISESTKVVHFTAAIETSFVGNIRNLFVNNHNIVPLNAYNGAEIISGLSYCYMLNQKVFQASRTFAFCPSTSSCLDSSSGPTCGCTRKSQELGLCQYKPEPSSLVMDGKGRFNFFPRLDHLNHGSGISIFFKAKKRNSIILYAEPVEVDNYALLVVLSNGSIEFQLRSPSLPKVVTIKKFHNCKSPYGSCTDNTWHHLSFSYNRIQMQTEVDGDRQTSEVPLHYQFKGFYFGNVQFKLQHLLEIENVSIFRGCFKHIFYQTGKDSIDLINLVQMSNSSKGSKLERDIGDIKYESVSFQTCSVRTKRDARSGSNSGTVITFKRPGGYLRSQQGWRTISEGKISFQIRTLKRNSLLLFSTSGWPRGEKRHALPHDGPIHPVNPVDRLTGHDIFSAEIREGFLVFLLNTGSGINEFATSNIWQGIQHGSSWFVADGVKHLVEIQLKNGSLSVELDGNTLQMRPKTKAKYTILNLNGILYIGGLPEELRGETPPQAWSARLREDFVGQLGSLSVDGVMLNLALESTVRWAKGYIKSDDSVTISSGDVCSKAENLCGPGECIQGSWTEPLCDCVQTNYTGIRCKEEATILTFDGFQGIGLRLSRLPKQSEAESLVLRLQTYQKNALLFESSGTSSTAPDRFGVEIADRQIVVFYNLGFETKRYATAEIEATGEWHTLRILRRSKRLEVSVDNTSYSFDIKDDAIILDSDYDCIGVLVDESLTQRTDLQYNAFIGRLSQFQLNGLDMLQIISEVANYRLNDNTFPAYDTGLVTLLDAWKENIEVTAAISKEDKIRAFPLHFQGGSAFMELSFSRAICVNIKFSLKTSTNRGILLFLSNSKEDYVGLELMDARLHMRYRYAIIRGQSAFEKTPALNDTQWHDIKIQLCADRSFRLELELDGEKHIPTGTTEGQETFSTHPFERLFLGGIPSSAGDLRKHFHSSYGYDGCLADIDILCDSSMVAAVNFPHPPASPLRIAKETLGVKLGCRLMAQKTPEGTWGASKASNQCRPGVCGFGGRCVQQLDMYFCDCTMSGFNGPVCTDVATTIKYAGGGTAAGCAVFEFSPIRNTSRDSISFGIQTKQNSPATLLHITSHSKSLDFLAIELVTYREMLALRLTYNMGGGIQILQNSNVDISDGMFHVVRVIRNNAHMQLQVDSGEVLESTSEGTSGNHFNEVYEVYVGCEPSRFISGTSNYAEHSFEGYISGVNINGVFLADLLLGETTSGIFYKEGKNLLIDPTFTPKVRQISNLPANDMGAEQLYQSPSNTIKPLVVAKPNCYQNDANLRNKLASCKTHNPNGIVIPQWSLPPFEEASSSLLPQENSQSLHASMTQHHQASIVGDNDLADSGGKLHSPESDELFHAWSHDRAPQDDAIRFNGGDSIPNLEELSEAGSDSQSSIISYFPSLHTWLLLAGCGAAILLIFLMVGYAIHKFRRRNEGSYNVEENRTFIDQRSTSTLAPTPLLTTPVEHATELTTLKRCTPVEVGTPNREWYV